MLKVKYNVVIFALAMRLCWGSTAIPEQTCIQAGQTFKIRGYTPGGGAKKPLAVYLHGTDVAYDTSASKDFTKMMAEKGFVAINLEYANVLYPESCKDWEQKAKTISACIDMVCQDFTDTLKTDCALGVAMYGYSQGAQMALSMRNWNNHVTAALAFSGSIASYYGAEEIQKKCFASAVLTLSKTKRRIVIGAKDGIFGGDASRMDGMWDSGIPTKVIEMAEASAGYTTCTSKYDCIQNDGSGYYVVTKNETGIDPMGHLWFLSNDFMSLQPVFKTATLDKKWGLPALLTWLAEASVNSGAGATGGGATGGGATAGASNASKAINATASSNSVTSSKSCRSHGTFLALLFLGAAITRF